MWVVHLNQKAIIIIAFSLLIIGLCVQNVESANSEEVDIYRGDTIEITARLLENITFGNPIPNQHLYFYDQTENQFIGSSLTNSDGYASIEWTIPLNHTLGNTLLNVTFYGNATLFLASSCQFVPLTILSRTNIQIHVNEYLLAPDDYLIIDILLENDENTPIQSATIMMYNDESLLATANSNTTGQVEFVVMCNDTWCSNGENVISIIYEGDLIHFNSEALESFLITFQKIPTSLTIQNLPNNVLLGQMYILDIELESEFSLPSNSVIDVYLDGSYFDSINLNETGSKKYNLSIDDHFDLGIHYLAFSFSETTRYASTSLESNIEVYSPAFINIQINEPLIIDSNQSIIIELTDSFHRSIANTIIELHDLSSGITRNIMTPSNSTRLSIEFPLLGRIGPRTLSINIMNNIFLTNNTLFYDVIIWAKSSIILIDSNIMGYASPTQEITLKLQVVGFERNCSFCQIGLIERNASIIVLENTDEFGVTDFTWNAPSTEGNFSLIITYLGNIDYYELPYNMTYNYYVTKKIPLTVIASEYTIIPALQEIQVLLQFILLNGTPPIGLQVVVNWIEYKQVVPIQTNGILFLQLIVPTLPSNYSLTFSIDESDSTLALSGRIQIEIDDYTALASQGVGIPSIATAAFLSIGIAALPIIRRWYMIG